MKGPISAPETRGDVHHLFHKLVFIISFMYIISLIYIISLRFNVDCEASSGLYGLAEGAFGTAGKGKTLSVAVHSTQFGMWNMEFPQLYHFCVQAGQLREEMPVSARQPRPCPRRSVRGPCPPAGLQASGTLTAPTTASAV